MQDLPARRGRVQRHGHDTGLSVAARPGGNGACRCAERGWGVESALWSGWGELEGESERAFFEMGEYCGG